jgi:predicted neutral ceramidase superfamily lipid hydrolase
MIIGYFGALLVMPEKISQYTKELEFFKYHPSYFEKIFSDYNNAILAIIFLALGIYYLYKKQNLKKETLWLAVSFIGTLLMAIFIWDRNAGNQYIFFVQSFEIILIASGIYFSAIFLRDNIIENKNKVFLVTVILSLLILPNYGYFFQNDNTYNQTSKSDSPDFRKIFSYFKKAKNPEDVLISRKFRNYYWSGTKTKLFDFGGELAEEKLSQEEVEKIVSENPSGWIIFSDNDDAYIANDAITYMEKNLEKVSNVNVRGKVSVYRWGYMEKKKNH